MTKLLGLSAAIVALTLTSACTKKKLDTDVKRGSYAIGQQIGQNMKGQNIDIDPDVMARSIKDALVGKSDMTPEEIQTALSKLQELAMKKNSEMAEKNKKAADEFLAKNKSAEGVTTTASGLQYSVITQGTGPIPTAEDVVKVHYKGSLQDGTVFESSYDSGNPAQFPVNRVIPGWTEGLTMMKVGSKYKLFIPPELAYGASGRPGIPPNSLLIFEVELLEIMPKDKK